MRAELPTFKSKLRQVFGAVSLNRPADNHGAALIYPKTQQLFFPMSMPKIENCVALLLSRQERGIRLDVLGSAGHPMINSPLLTSNIIRHSVLYNATIVLLNGTLGET